MKKSELVNIIREMISMEDLIPGGKGDNIAPGEFDQTELRVGMSVEREHTDSDDKAKEIAIDHLSEDPKYYSKLIGAGLVDEKPALILAKKLGMINEETKLDQPIKNIKVADFWEATPGHRMYKLVIKYKNGKEQKLSPRDAAEALGLEFNDVIKLDKFEKATKNMGFKVTDSEFDVSESMINENFDKSKWQMALEDALFAQYLLKHGGKEALVDYQKRNYDNPAIDKAQDEWMKSEHPDVAMDVFPMGFQDRPDPESDPETVKEFLDNVSKLIKSSDPILKKAFQAPEIKKPVLDLEKEYKKTQSKSTEYPEEINFGKAKFQKQQHHPRHEAYEPAMLIISSDFEPKKYKKFIIELRSFLKKHKGHGAFNWNFSEPEWAIVNPNPKKAMALFQKIIPMLQKQFPEVKWNANKVRLSEQYIKTKEMKKDLKLTNIMESAFGVNRNQTKGLGEIITDKDMPPFALSEEEWLDKWGINEAWTKKDFYASYSRVGVGIKDIYKDGYTDPKDSAEDVADDIYTEFGKLAVKLAKKHKIKIDEVSIFLNKI